MDQGLRNGACGPDRRSVARYTRMLRLNYRFITPLVSRLGPAAAYRINRITGLIGKPEDLHTSFIYGHPAAPVLLGALKKYLGLDDIAARRVMRSFFLYETRLQLEKNWMLGDKAARLPSAIDQTAVGHLAAEIREKGPHLLLSAHTFNLFMLWWSLRAHGVRFCIPAADQGAPAAAGILHQTVIDYIAAFSRTMPVLYTNEGSTVRRSIELVKQGYSVMLYMDVLGYRRRDPSVTLLGRRIGVPSGCLRIFEETGIPATFVCTYGTGLSNPYGLLVRPLDVSAGTIDLSGWAAGLEEVLRISPESWVGWLNLHMMI